MDNEQSNKEESAKKESSGNIPTIKIAPPIRESSTGGADPGPGDLNAAPSEVPQMVEIPSPPQASGNSTSGTGASSVQTSSSNMTAAVPSAINSMPTTNSKQLSQSKKPTPPTPPSPPTPSGPSRSPPPSPVPPPAKPGLSQSAKPANTNQLVIDGPTPFPSNAIGKSSSNSAMPSTSNSPQQQQKLQPQSAAAATAATTSVDNAKKGVQNQKHKKVTRFRYHKRISVSTKGKQNPAAIMEQVNEKDAKAGISVDKLNPQELMKKAGIDGKEGTHWRIRMRQTKRTKTKDGKTITQTKVAYRDSEGHNSIKTVDGEMCKKCNRKVDDCQCGGLPE